MSNLKSTIESLANDFAMNIINALRSASIDELTRVGGFSAPRRGPGRPPKAESTAGGSPAASSASSGGRSKRRGRLGRRTTADIGKMVRDIVSVLQKNAPSGLRSEQIRSALGVQAKELPRPLADGLADGRITKTGQKRATTYFAGSGGGKKGGGRRKRG